MSLHEDDDTGSYFHTRYTMSTSCYCFLCQATCLSKTCAIIVIRQTVSYLSKKKNGKTRDNRVTRKSHQRNVVNRPEVEEDKTKTERCKLAVITMQGQFIKIWPILILLKRVSNGHKFWMEMNPNRWDNFHCIEWVELNNVMRMR